MAEHLLDTNVLSKIFYGNVDVKNFVDNLETGIETIVYIECIQGSISNSDKKRIKGSLQNLKFYSLTNDIAQKSIELIDTYSNTRGLLLADAIIAATALHYDLILITYNLKDFQFIRNLKLLKPPV
ncbi:MAG TPA: PIN domain-containing protein [Pyrinomonadaceae bacterium]|nr:PIN domain-containing protein [Pyrinomonadaceae bacterium]